MTSVAEDTGHTGRGSVVQILARRLGICRCRLFGQPFDFARP